MDPTKYIIWPEIVRAPSKWVKTSIKQSNMSTFFEPGKNKGVFAKQDIKKGQVLFTFPYISNMNDGLVNFTESPSVKNSSEFYNFLIDFELNYHNDDKFKRVINTLMAVTADMTPYMVASRDIKKGEELLKVYGYATWVLEFFQYITNKNLAAYYHFLKTINMEQLTHSDQVKVNYVFLMEIITQLLGRDIDLTLEEYDIKMETIECQSLCLQIEKYVKQETHKVNAYDMI